ncbi:sulfate adenylyltransferase [Aureococcus anophagefferens]|nr:sulfate adenylyltransferase [Aureococcus anophagefferens]
MDEATYGSVVNSMELPSGLMFSLPVVFDTDDEAVAVGAKILLKQGNLRSRRWRSRPFAPDKPSNGRHGARQVLPRRQAAGLNKPAREFPCETPAEVRERLPDGVDIVAFQCRNPVHRAHYELFTRALDAPNVEGDGVVLVHPTCGPTQPGDIPGDVRYKTYEVLKEETANPRTFWAYLPYSMHMAGPREAIHHMMIRKNFGCTHFIIGRDMAGCKSSIDEEDFYGAYDAQDFALENGPKMGMQAVPSLNLVYSEEKGYVTAEEAKEENLTALKLRHQVPQDAPRRRDIPEWFAFKSAHATPAPMIRFPNARGGPPGGAKPWISAVTFRL